MSFEREQPRNPQERTRFGLPERWPLDTSTKCLETLRAQLARTSGPVTKRTVQAILLPLLDQIANEYLKFLPPLDFAVGAPEALSGTDSELEHLALVRPEKITRLWQKYPAGLPINSEGMISQTLYHIKWDNIVSYETFALLYHDQSFATIARRGGISAFGLFALVFGHKTRTLDKFFSGKIPSDPKAFFARNNWIVT